MEKILKFFLFVIVDDSCHEQPKYFLHLLCFQFIPQNRNVSTNVCHIILINIIIFYGEEAILILENILY